MRGGYPEDKFVLRGRHGRIVIVTWKNLDRKGYRKMQRDMDAVMEWSFSVGTG